MNQQAGWLGAVARVARNALAVLGAVGLVGACDLKNIAELEPGVSTEADVKERFGPPEAVWDGEDGAQIYEYNRQPEGVVNYMITIGPDGKLARIEQVLTEANFDRVQPGMPMEQVRRMLGKPRKVTTYALKQETHYDWRYQPQSSTEMWIFSAVFNTDMRVVNTLRTPDPDIQNRR